MDEKALMHQFVSLGEDCEFSFIQREAGAEPLEMLRFTGTTMVELIAAFESRFSAIGDPEFTDVRVARKNEVWGFNTRHKFETHIFGDAGSMDLASIRKKFIQKMTFLRDKLFEDLAEGQKFFVYKRRDPVSYHDVLALYTAVRKLGDNPFLWVVKANKDHRAGEVEHLGGGLFKGYIDEFTPYGRPPLGSFKIWLAICGNAYDMLRSMPESLRGEPPPSSKAAHSWIATQPTTLKKFPLVAASLPAEHKMGFETGDLVMAEGFEREAGHLKLINVDVNGQALDEPWFAWPPHWQDLPRLSISPKSISARGARSEVDDFDYVIEKIARTPFSNEPFHHLYIENLFDGDHFDKIVKSPEVEITPVGSDEELIAELYKRSYKEIQFPGTTTDLAVYLKWHQDRAINRMTDPNCEGFGVTFRLQKTAPGTILEQLTGFFRSPSFWKTLAFRFDIDLADVTVDIGLQKYLDGYEISPHPDIRKKALTFMINVNPAEDSESIDYHTRYLEFESDYRYIQNYWSENQNAERCWVAWESCKVIKQQVKNNSMVIFAPADDTLHAVKANYDHLKTQRTQFYGNLWYKNSSATVHPRWDEIAKMGGLKNAS